MGEYESKRNRKAKPQAGVGGVWRGWLSWRLRTFNTDERYVSLDAGFVADDNLWYNADLTFDLGGNYEKNKGAAKLILVGGGIQICSSISVITENTLRFYFPENETEIEMFTLSGQQFGFIAPRTGLQAVSFASKPII